MEIEIQLEAGISQSTTSQYMSLLHQAGFAVLSRMGKWTYYRRDEDKFSQFMQRLNGIMTLTGVENA